jgi:hypothetical protein
VPHDAQIETNIPQRLDRLPWSRWHTKMVVALGITWLLDGLEVTLAGSLANVLKDKNALGLTSVQVGASATGYLAGAVIGALFFGWLTDRLGRKKLFLITLALYLSATAATVFFLGILELSAVPHPDRCRHRRRVCSHQLGNRRIGSRIGTRQGRPGDQCNLLDRRRYGRTSVSLYR